jgi:hypothetical protein
MLMHDAIDGLSPVGGAEPLSFFFSTLATSAGVTVDWSIGPSDILLKSGADNLQTMGRTVDGGE